MNTEDALTQLEALGTDKLRAQNTRHGAGKQQGGVRLGDIRKLAKTIKTDNELAKALCKTKNIDARLLATLVIKPKQLSATELDRMVRSVSFMQVADWLNAYVVKHHADQESLRQRWMETDHPLAARSGWTLTAERVVKNPEGLDLPALLDRIESELGTADPAAQWTMNCCLAEIGIQVPAQRKRALVIGEQLGVCRDYPTSKGCTSPFAPTWIGELVKRQG